MLKMIEKITQSIQSKQNKKRKIQTADSGRSMVEMLGVLAIVGVLSIAGIMGYSYAMKKYQANKVAAELNLLSNQMAMIMEQPHDGDFELSLGEPYDNGTLTSGAYAFSYGCGTDSTVKETCAEDEHAYYVRLENVPEELCQTLAQTTQFLSYLTEQQVNGEIDTTGAHCIESEIGNAFVLFFETQEEDEWEDEVLTSNVEENEAESTISMMTETAVTTSSTGITASASPIVSTTSMMTLTTTKMGTPIITGSPVTTTISTEEGYFLGLDYNNYPNLKSYHCNYQEGVSATEDECNKCDNTDFVRGRTGSGLCFSCNYPEKFSDRRDSDRAKFSEACGKCGLGVDWTDPSRFQCAPNSSNISNCDSDEFKTNDGACYSCSSATKAFDVSETECKKCDSISKWVLIGNDCYSCKQPYLENREESNKALIRLICDKCGLGVNWTGTRYYQCASGPNDVTECTNGYFKNTEGICTRCWDSGGISTTTETDCKQCDTTSDKRVYVNNLCYSCTAPRIWDYTETGKELIKQICAKCGLGVNWDIRPLYCSSNTNDVGTEF